MENVFADQIIKKKTNVCELLQKAVIQLCEQTYADITHSNLEVDGIICISFSNSCDQHVVKIHEKLGKEKTELGINKEYANNCASTDEISRFQSPCPNYNQISDQASSPQTDIEVLTYNDQDNMPDIAEFVADQHVLKNVNENEMQNDNLCGVMTDAQNSRKESQDLSNETDRSPSKKKRQFVESVEGDYVIVKVEPDDLDIEEQENLKDSNIVQSCFSQTSNTCSFSPKSGSYIRQDSVERLSVVDDNNDTMYMIPSDLGANTKTEAYPYQPSVHNSIAGDRGNIISQDETSLQFGNRSSANEMSDVTQHEGVNSLTRKSFSPNTVSLNPLITKQMNKKQSRRSTGSINQSSNHEDFNPSAFHNFNVPLAPLDAAPVHDTIVLSSISLSTDCSSGSQSSTIHDSQYHSYNSFSNSISNTSSQLPGGKSRVSLSGRSHLSTYNNRGRISALSHGKRGGAMAIPRNANFAAKLLKRNQKSAVPNNDVKSSFVCPPSDSFIPSCPGSDKYRTSEMGSGTSQDKLFFCRYCGKGFTMKCTRSRHEKTICSPAGTGSYRCELCPKEFTRSDSRYRHMFKAHGVQS